MAALPGASGARFPPSHRRSPRPVQRGHGKASAQTFCFQSPGLRLRRPRGPRTHVAQVPRQGRRRTSGHLWSRQERAVLPPELVPNHFTSHIPRVCVGAALAQGPPVRPAAAMVRTSPATTAHRSSSPDTPMQGGRKGSPLDGRVGPRVWSRSFRVRLAHRLLLPGDQTDHVHSPSLLFHRQLMSVTGAGSDLVEVWPPLVECGGVCAQVRGGRDGPLREQEKCSLQSGQCGLGLMSQ